MKLFTQTSLLSIGLAIALALPSISLATPMTASEQIVDQLALPEYRDFVVYHEIDGSIVDIETVDAEIIDALHIDNHFGYLGTAAVSYSHHIGWMDLDNATILGASLELVVADENGNLENLVLDFDDYLPIFSGDSASVTLGLYGLDLSYEDHFLSVDFSLADGSDPFQILSSNLSLTYEYSTTPEPSAMTLFGTGLAGIFAVNRRKALSSSKV